MKTKFLTFLLMGLSSFSFAQLKITPVCNSFVVDILDGKVNGVLPDFTITQIKEKLPCFTGSEPEDASSPCGGVVQEEII